jgi:peptidoglycan/LPS O-acetylase OafA/YrhL
MAFWTNWAKPEGDQHEAGGSKEIPGWLIILRNSPLGIIVSGTSAVSIFFVLSGFVLPL